jgi:PAS domain S-box-containing protein
MPKADTKLFPPDSQKDKKFTGSLARTVLIALLLISLLPVVLFGITAVLRSRILLYDQTKTQLETFALRQRDLLNESAEADQLALGVMLEDKNLTDLLKAMIKEKFDNFKLYTVSEQLLYTYNRASTSESGEEGANFDRIAFITPDGKAAVSSDFSWNGKDFSSSNLMKLLTEKENATIAVYNPEGLYSNKLVIFSSKPYKDSDGKLLGTLVGATVSPLLSDALTDIQPIIPEAKPYFLTRDGQLLSIDTKTSSIVPAPGLNNLVKWIDFFTLHNQTSGSTSYSAANNETALLYAIRIPGLEMSYAVEVPERAIYQNINLFDPINLGVVFLTLLLSGVIVYFGTQNIINPLQELTVLTQKFAHGSDFSLRAPVKRRDEIGQLAYNFNQMVEQLSDLYRSLEDKVEQRTHQLRTAAEIARIATSTPNQDEMLQRTASLVVKRFGYSYASLYLLDPSGTQLILQQYESDIIRTWPSRGYRLSVDSNTIQGWVVMNHQAKVIADITNSDFPNSRLTFPETRSEIAIPISVGDQLYGVLNIQSTSINAFDSATLFIFQTLTNQVAAALENTRLLQSTQINLQETNLLYRTSRSITQARDEKQAIDILNNSLKETPYTTLLFNVTSEMLRLLTLNVPLGRSTTVPLNLTLPLGKALDLLTVNEMMMFTDLSRPTELDSVLDLLRRHNSRSAAVFAIKSDNQITKLLAIGSDNPNPINDATVQPFINLVEVLSNTLNRFQLLKTLESRLGELQAITNVSQTISTQINLDKLYAMLHEQFAQTFGEDIGFSIALYNKTKNQIMYPYAAEKGNEVKRENTIPENDLASLVFKNQQPLVISRNVEQRARSMGINVTGKVPHSWMGVPLAIGGETFGALLLDDQDSENRFSENDLKLTATLAPQISTAIRNGQLVSEMQNAFQAYEKERYLLNTLLDNIPDPIYVINNEMSYTRVSAAMANFTGLSSPEKAYGKFSFDLFHNLMAAQIYNSDQAVIKSGKPQIGQVEKHITRDGRNDVWFLTSRVPLLDNDGNTNGVLGIFRDITELKLAEELAQQRSQQLRTAAEIARDTSATLDINEVLAKSVNLVRDRFGFYHSSIFLVDSLGEYAVLRESTGEAGARMKAQSHRLAVGSKSVVGTAVGTAKPRIVNDVTIEPNYYANPLLPDTRSEIAIPLIVGERVLGAVDVQSTKIGAFQEDDVAILQILADQLAIAVLNANLFAQTQESLTRHSQLYEITTSAASTNTLEDSLAATVTGLYEKMGIERVLITLKTPDNKLEVRASAGYTNIDFSRIVLAPGEGIIGQAALEKQPVLVPDTLNHPRYIPLDEKVRSELAVPILYRGDLIGVLNVESLQSAAFDKNEQDLLGTLGSSLGALISNAQLIQQIRQQVERQELLFEIASKIRRSADMQTILETSATEIGKALRARRAKIEITGAPANNEVPTKLPDAINPIIHTDQNNGNNNGKSNGHNNGHHNGHEEAGE